MQIKFIEFQFVTKTFLIQLLLFAFSFRYIVDDSTFFVMVKNVKEPEHHRKLKGYVIKEKLLRAALTRDKQKRCPRNL